MRGGTRLRRIAWFVMLWLAGVAAAGVLAWLVRAVMGEPS